jgi:thiosulfate reductase cytochrome b subunit
MAPIGKLLIVFGLVLVGAGLLLLLSDKIPWLGRLPGDITVRRENFTFFFPVVTCIVISVILSLILWFFRK